MPGGCGMRGAVYTLALFWLVLPASGRSFAQHAAGQVGLSALQEDT